MFKISRVGCKFYTKIPIASEAFNDWHMAVIQKGPYIICIEGKKTTTAYTLNFVLHIDTLDSKTVHPNVLKYWDTLNH